MLEHRASVLVAASPPSAGKTTTLTALLDFLPPGNRLLHIRGWLEDFSFRGRTDPHTTYLLCNEIGPDLPEYLWGPGVAELFGTLADGYAMGSTMHADTIDEALETLLSPPLNVPEAALGRMTLVVLLRLQRANGRFLRRVDSAYFLEPDGASGMPTTVPLAHWDETASGLRHSLDGAGSRLSAWLHLPADAFAQEVTEREQYLQWLVDDGRDSITDVRQALALYGIKRTER